MPFPYSRSYLYLLIALFFTIPAACVPQPVVEANEQPLIEANKPAEIDVDGSGRISLFPAIATATSIIAAISDFRKKLRNVTIIAERQRARMCIAWMGGATA
jgi:hypothetical protein